ncbi:MAG TPA: hypothetical protein VN700_19815 [Vicinamibacterales bacterium]|nr:hypothetical protein [Vicinamibacterales bacterium]
MPSVRAATAQMGQVVVPVTVKLTVVLSRFTGDKKTGNLPFLLMVIPGSGERDGESTDLQTGARVPVPTTTFNQDKSSPTTSYQYQQFGTNIRAQARVIDPSAGIYSVSLAVTDSQLLSDSPEQVQYAQGVRLPRYQSFTSSNRLILKDGQTIQYTAATDKTSGEVIKLDVTLNVIK